MSVSAGPTGRTTEASGPKRAIQLVVFSLEGRDFALELAEVAEILPMVAITEVPESLPWVPGVINLRGRTLPLIDVRQRFGLAALGLDPDAAIIVTDLEGEAQRGLMVDRVLEVASVASAEFDPVAASGGGVSAVRGVARSGDRMIVVLDAMRLSEGSSRLELPVTEQ